jgi:hypothetical protein
MGKKWINSKIFLLPKTKSYNKLEKSLNNRDIKIFKPWAQRPMHHENFFKKNQL